MLKKFIFFFCLFGLIKAEEGITPKGCILFVAPHEAQEQSIVFKELHKKLEEAICKFHKIEKELRECDCNLRESLNREYENIPLDKWGYPLKDDLGIYYRKVDEGKRKYNDLDKKNREEYEAFKREYDQKVKKVSDLIPHIIKKMAQKYQPIAIINRGNSNHVKKEYELTQEVIDIIDKKFRKPFGYFDGILEFTNKY